MNLQIVKKYKKTLGVLEKIVQVDLPKIRKKVGSFVPE